jgi:hypothetical protein
MSEQSVDAVRSVARLDDEAIVSAHACAKRNGVPVEQVPWQVWALRDGARCGAGTLEPARLGAPR